MSQVSFNGEPSASTSTKAAPFKLVKWREGYDVADVDALMARIEAGSVSSGEVGGARLTPVRLKPGYDMCQVDDYLDRIEKELRAAGR